MENLGFITIFENVINFLFIRVTCTLDLSRLQMKT